MRRLSLTVPAAAKDRFSERAQQLGLKESALFRVMDEVFSGMTDEELEGRVRALDLEKLTLKRDFTWKPQRAD
jgi:hypothetical protein